jgi:hypothetical protein
MIDIFLLGQMVGGTCEKTRHITNVSRVVIKIY